MTKPVWRRLTRWPATAEAYLGLPEGTGAFCHQLFEDERCRVEVLEMATGEREVRIPCRPGELYPVNRTHWGLVCPGGFWAKRVVNLFGKDALMPLSMRPLNADDLGTRHDEVQLWLPMSRVLEVAQLLRARRRRPAPKCGGFRRAS